MFAALLCALPVWPVVPCAGDEKPVNVTVVVVLATGANATVDPKLKELAKEVQKRDPKLTGFRIAAVESKSIAVGDSATLALADKQTLLVKINKQKDENGRITLELTPPQMEAVTYACACDKFFPVVTPHKTKDGEHLIIAVMAKPCTGKK
jgi:hypothetical protein